MGENGSPIVYVKLMEYGVEKMKKIVYLLAFSLIFFSTAQLKALDNTYGSTKGGKELRKVGAAGAQFLKIPIGARGSALGGAYSAMVNDLSAVYWNSAGVADIRSMTGEFHYTQWLFDFSHNFAAVAMPLNENFTLAAHVTSLNSSDIEITTVERPEGTGVEYQASDVAVGITFAGYLTDQFSFGITAKYINNSFADMDANGIAFDVGTMYNFGIRNIKLGFSIHNLGTEQKFTGQGLRTTKKYHDALWAAPIDAEYLSYYHNIPIIFRAGLSGEIYKDDQHKFDAALGFATLSDTPEQFSIGGEYTWKNMISARVGYVFNTDQFGFSAGVGFKYLTDQFHGIIDYSISPTFDIGLVNRISIQIGLGK